MDYEIIFRKKQHYLTKVDRTTNKGRRILIRNYNQLHNALKHQKNNEDIFITKYAIDCNINTIILDFDHTNKTIALKEVTRLRNYLKTKQVNCIIVSSTNKGYHLYIQIPFLNFKIIGLTDSENNVFFNDFIYKFINYEKLQFESLDKTNFHAGLGGNIRLIGSIHPKTQQRVEIIEGEFIDIMDSYSETELLKLLEYTETTYKETKILFYHKKKEYEKKINENRKKRELKFGKTNNPIEDNDLRKIMPDLFGGKNKLYSKGYMFMQCPWHSDINKPSLKVTKEWYYCTACGEKGNIWTLHKKGYINLFEGKS